MQNHNLEVEQSIIGSLIKDPTHANCRETLDSLDVNDFYSLAHRHIYQTIKKMTEQKNPIDLPLIEEEMQSIEFDYGGFFYLAEMMKNSFGASNMSGYVSVVKSLARTRDLQAALMNANEMIAGRVSYEDVISELSNTLTDISTSSSGRELRHIREVEGDFLDEMDVRAETGGSIVGLTTGIDELDERINGIGDDYLVVIASSPSMGKTLFCQTVAQHVSVEQRKNTMFFSMEMSERSLYERFISGLGNVSASILKSARLDSEANGRISEAAVALRNSGLYITDEAKQSVGQIRAKARKHKAKHGKVAAIFIDYLGLMKLGKADRHDLAIGNITRDLKELAKEIETPIFLVVQSKRPDGTKSRPNMASLKDSSCIEADADIIMFVHRQEILEPETELKGITELIIAKDRHNDGNGTVYLEKINGKFVGLKPEQVGQIQMKQEQSGKTKQRGVRQ